MFRIIQLLKSFKRREDGAAFVEFALIAPVIFLVIAGIVEISLVMFGSNALESAVTNSSRLGKTGYTEQGTSREDMIYAMVRSRLSGIMDPDLVNVTTKVYAQIEQIGQPEPFSDQNGNQSYDIGEPYNDVNGSGHWEADMASTGLGSAGQVVVYTVTYPWEIKTPVLRELLTEDGVFTLSSSIVVRNEPYGTAS